MFKLISPLEGTPLFFATEQEAVNYRDELPETKEDRDEYQIIQVEKEGVNNMTQAQHYEQQADRLSGVQQERALRAAQNALSIESPIFLVDFKRLQNKLINCLTCQHLS